MHIKNRSPVIQNGKIIGGSFLCMDDYTVVYKNNTFSISEEKCENIQKNYESIIMLDVARRYYTVDEIKRIIDILSVNENSTIQVHAVLQGSTTCIQCGGQANVGINPYVINLSEITYTTKNGS